METTRLVTAYTNEHRGKEVDSGGGPRHEGGRLVVGEPLGCVRIRGNKIREKPCKNLQ